MKGKECWYLHVMIEEDFEALSKCIAQMKSDSNQKNIQVSWRKIWNYDTELLHRNKPCGKATSDAEKFAVLEMKKKRLHHSIKIERTKAIIDDNLKLSPALQVRK